MVYDWDMKRNRLTPSGDVERVVTTSEIEDRFGIVKFFKSAYLSEAMRACADWIDEDITREGFLLSHFRENSGIWSVMVGYPAPSADMPS